MKNLFSYIFPIFLMLLTSGTMASEQKIFNVNPNQDVLSSASSAPAFYQIYGSYLFFVTNRSSSTQSLWRMDLTNNNIKKIIYDFNWRDTEGQSFSIVNDRIVYLYPLKGYISVDLSGLDKKLILSSKTTIDPRLGNQVISYNGYVYFPVKTQSSGKSTLWRSDGTIEGTSEVNLCKSACYVNPRQMVVSDNKLFFIASSPENTNFVWSIDNTNKATIFSEINVGSNERIFIDPKGILFNSPTQLWFTNGASKGSYPITPFATGQYSNAEDSVRFNDMVIVATNDLYTIADNGEGESTLIDTNSTFYNPKDLTKFNNAVYFLGKKSNSATYRYKLMKTSGIAGDINDVFEFTTLIDGDYKIIGTKGNKLVLLRYGITPSSYNEIINEIWISDGTTEGTIKLTENGVPKELWDNNAWMFLSNELLFSGFTDENGTELWRTDSSIEGTFLKKDLSYDIRKNQNGPMVSDGEYLYYVMGVYKDDDGKLLNQSEQELWKTNILTMESSKVVQWADPSQHLIQIVTVEGGQYWWVENPHTLGQYDLLFYDYVRSDVSILIKDKRDLCLSDNLKNNNVVTINKKYFFHAYATGNTGCQLWVSDGTADGTKALTSLPRTNYQGRMIDNIVTFNDEVYFSLDVTLDEFKALRSAVFKTDGTIDGTKEVFRLPLDTESRALYVENLLSTPQGIFIVSGYDSIKLWFWQSTTLTTLLESPNGNSNTNSFYTKSLVRFKQGIGFIYNNMIWSSNGTESGTLPLISLKNVDFDRWSKQLYSNPAYDRLIYSAYDEEENYRLWVSDGTYYGTKTKGPILKQGNARVSAIVGNDLYVTDFFDDPNPGYYTQERLVRYSLDNNESEPYVLTVEPYSDSRIENVYVTAQGRLFFNYLYPNNSTIGREFLGPYVTAQLTKDDMDNDGVMDHEDAFPLHANEQLDTDENGIGNNFDNDDDGDGIEDRVDLYPLNYHEWGDYDNDGIGDTTDLDDDNDGVNDWLDSYPRDSSRSDNQELEDNVVDTDDNEKITSATSSGGGIHYYIIILGIIIIRFRQNIKCIYSTNINRLT